MLRAAALGMFLYGLHDAVSAVVDLLGEGPLPWWASLWRLFAGGTLTLAAAFVRASLPGGIALAFAGLLGLQAISLHNDTYFYGELLLAPQLGRAGYGALLVTLAYLGWDSNEQPTS